MLLHYDSKRLWLEYVGESLYRNFDLPSDWKSQIRQIMIDLQDLGIYYPEFKLQNICVRGKEISFVDFGLAELDTGKSNEANCERFIWLLGLLEERFRTEHDPNRRRILISNLLRNTDPRLS